MLQKLVKEREEKGFASTAKDGMHSFVPKVHLENRWYQNQSSKYSYITGNCFNRGINL